MDIREALLEEHSKSQRNKIVKYIGTDKKKFAELMRVFFGNENRMTQRAAWPLSYSVAEHPELITPAPPLGLDPTRVTVAGGGRHVSIACNPVSGECVQREQELGSLPGNLSADHQNAP